MSRDYTVIGTSDDEFFEATGSNDVFAFGDVESGSLGNDVIWNFDTNNFDGGEAGFDTPVSYTHLTLPTIYSV